MACSDVSWLIAGFAFGLASGLASCRCAAYDGARKEFFGVDAMNKPIALCASFLVLSLSAWSVSAQSDTASRNEVAKLRTDTGVIMVSAEQGPFNTAAQEQRVATGDRLMVAKDSVATVVYDNGCEKTYDQAGVYEIDADCKLGWWSRSTPAMRTAVIGGGAVLAAVIIHNHDDDDAPPVSR